MSPCCKVGKDAVHCYMASPGRHLSHMPPTCHSAQAHLGPSIELSSADALDLCRLLSSFHTGLEEVTIISYGDAGRQQQQGAVPSKAVQLHSFLDPLKGGWVAAWLRGRGLSALLRAAGPRPGNKRQAALRS